jgi:hypothetical protein
MPFLGSRGGGSVRGFGRFGKNLLLTFIDSFLRTSSLSLGTSSDGKAVWRNVRGTWTANGSSAISADAASSNGIAVVDMDGSTVVNQQVNTNNSGGVGLSFWVTDANSYYALYPSYTFSSSTSTGCGGSVSTNYSVNCQTVYRSAQGGNVGCAEGGEYSFNACETPQELCQRLSGSPLTSYIYYLNNSVCYYQPTTITTNTYTSRANLLKVESGTSSALITNSYLSSNSTYSKASSIALSTSGNTISYSFYSQANKGGSVIASGSTSAVSPLKSTSFGIFKGVSATEQGSTLNGFDITVGA